MKLIMIPLLFISDNVTNEPERKQNRERIGVSEIEWTQYIQRHEG